jgi:hypothetical protein
VPTRAAAPKGSRACARRSPGREAACQQQPQGSWSTALCTGELPARAARRARRKSRPCTHRQRGAASPSPPAAVAPARARFFVIRRSRAAGISSAERGRRTARSPPRAQDHPYRSSSPSSQYNRGRLFRAFASAPLAEERLEGARVSHELRGRWGRCHRPACADLASTFKRDERLRVEQTMNQIGSVISSAATRHESPSSRPGERSRARDPCPLRYAAIGEPGGRPSSRSGRGAQ